LSKVHFIKINTGMTAQANEIKFYKLTATNQYEALGTFRLNNKTDRVRVTQAAINIGRYCRTIKENVDTYMYGVDKNIWGHEQKRDTSTVTLTFAELTKIFHADVSSIVGWKESMTAFYNETANIASIEKATVKTRV